MAPDTPTVHPASLGMASSCANCFYFPLILTSWSVSEQYPTSTIYMCNVMPCMGGSLTNMLVIMTRSGLNFFQYSLSVCGVPRVPEGFRHSLHADCCGQFIMLSCIHDHVVVAICLFGNCFKNSSCRHVVSASQFFFQNPPHLSLKMLILKLHGVLGYCQ